MSFDEQLEQVGSFNIDGSFESDNELETKQIQLRKAINALDAEERLIIMMYYFEEQSIEEISKTSGLSKSNVKIRLFRLRKKLKETITRLNKVETVVY